MEKNNITLKVLINVDLFLEIINTFKVASPHA